MAQFSEMDLFSQFSHRGTAEDCQNSFEQIVQHYRPQSSLDYCEADLFPTNTRVLWSCDPSVVIRYLEHGASVKFRANDLRTTYLFPQQEIPADHKGPFAGFRYAYAGVLEIELNNTLMNLGVSTVVIWFVVPLTPAKSFEMLTLLYAHGWEPATGKLNEECALVQSLPVMSETEGLEPEFLDSRNLTTVLEFAAREDIKDISTIDLHVRYPRQIAYHYRGLTFSDRGGRRRNVHIHLETNSQVELMGFTRDEVGLDAVIIKARASREGLQNFEDCESDLAFTQTLLRAMGLTDSLVARVELLEEAYIEEYYEDLNTFGYN